MIMLKDLRTEDLFVWYDKCMINSHKQTGNASIIIVISLAIAIIGALGYVAWNNFLAPKEDTRQENVATRPETATDEKLISNQRYENETFTFEYPNEGWAFSGAYHSVDEPDEITPLVRTNDFAQTGMGLDTGAEILVNVYPATQSLSEMKENVATFANRAAKDLADTNVDDVSAFTYSMSYEGERYHTVFIHGGSAYDIIYQYADNSEASTYMAGYKMVVSTFKFKE